MVKKDSNEFPVSLEKLKEDIRAEMLTIIQTASNDNFDKHSDQPAKIIHEISDDGLDISLFTWEESSVSAEDNNASQRNGKLLVKYPAEKVTLKILFDEEGCDILSGEEPDPNATVFDQYFFESTLSKPALAALTKARIILLARASLGF